MIGLLDIALLVGENTPMIGKYLIKKTLFKPADAPEKIEFALDETPIEINKNTGELRAYITVKNRNRADVTIDRLFFEFNIHGVVVENIYLDKHKIGHWDERKIGIISRLNDYQISRIPEKNEIDRVHLSSRGYFTSDFFDFEVHHKYKETQNFKVH